MRTKMKNKKCRNCNKKLGQDEGVLNMWEFDDGTDWRFVWLKFCDDKCHLNFELRNREERV